MRACVYRLPNINVLYDFALSVIKRNEWCLEPHGRALIPPASLLLYHPPLLLLLIPIGCRAGRETLTARSVYFFISPAGRAIQNELVCCEHEMNRLPVNTICLMGPINFE